MRGLQLLSGLTKRQIEDSFDTSGTPADNSVSLPKLTLSALASILAPWQRLKDLATQFETGAVAGTKYLIIPGQTNNKEANSFISQPYLVRWKASRHGVQGLVTRLRITASVEAGAAEVGRKIRFALCTIKREGGKVIPNEEVAGSAFEIDPTGVTNGSKEGEVAAAFTPPADGIYAITASPVGTNIANNVGINASLWVVYAAA